MSDQPTIGDRIGPQPTEEEMNEALYGRTAKDLLTRWDEGKSVFSLERGGLGPGYEQAIQVLAIELVRDSINAPIPEVPAPSWGDWTVHRIDKACGGFSGAQVSAAKWLAWKWLTIGPMALIALAKEQGHTEDLIQVSKFWPRAES